jgi:hypothetical protein
VEFFYYQSYIICKSVRKVIVFNTLTRAVETVPVQRDDFTVEFMPPFLFALIEGQFLTLYEEEVGKEPRRVKISKL